MRDALGLLTTKKKKVSKRSMARVDHSNVELARSAARLAVQESY
jgi:hypothetical protein